jgi:hypothetical protein
MEKIFKNDFDQIISEYLAAELGKYTIDFVDSGNLRKVEHYSQNRLRTIDHYRVGNETDAAILASLGNAIVSNVTINIVDVENHGNFIIRTYLCYIKGATNNQREKFLFDSEGNVISFTSYNASNHQILGATEKFLFNNEGEEILGFEYNDDGSLNYVWGDLVNRTDRVRKGSIYSDEIDLYFPDLLAENPYYADATFLP